MSQVSTNLILHVSISPSHHHIPFYMGLIWYHAFFCTCGFLRTVEMTENYTDNE